jgi:hypothetical protein
MIKRTTFRKHPCLFDGRSPHVDTAVPSLGRGGIGIGSWFLTLFFLAPAQESKKCSILTFNVHGVYMAREEMILMRENPSRAIEKGGPCKSRLFWA